MMTTTTHSAPAAADLEVGRLAQDQRERGRDWSTITTDLGETSPAYVRRAAAAYLEHVAATMRQDQLELF